MMTARFLQSVGTFALLVATAGCAGDTPRTTGSTSPTGGSSTSSTSPTPSPTPTASASGAPVDPCLLKIADVSEVLGGEWTVIERDAQGCTYRSDRGALFGIQDVQEPTPAPALQAARQSCDTTPREVAVTNSFACVEHAADGDLVIGNIISRARLFVFVIVPFSAGDHDPELDAMTVLLRQAPPA